MGDKKDKSTNGGESQSVDDVVEGKHDKHISDIRGTCLTGQETSELRDHNDNDSGDKTSCECDVIHETESTFQNDNNGSKEFVDSHSLGKNVNNRNYTLKDTVSYKKDTLNGTKMHSGLDSDLKKPTKGNDYKDGDLTVSSEHDNMVQEGAVGGVEHNVTTRLNNAPLTYVDEDDGLIKFFGKACGVDEEHLLDEDDVPYSNIPNRKDKRSQVQRMQESVGARLAQAGQRMVSPTRGSLEATFQQSQSEATGRTNLQEEGFNVSNETPESDPEMRGRTYYKRTDNRRALSPRSQPYSNPSQSVPNESPQEATRTILAQAVDEDRYDFSHTMRGYMVLIINDKFPRQTPRDGALEDLRNMKAIGRKFGFRSMHYRMNERNLSKPELLDVLLEAQRMDHSNCDCFLFMISTHGLEQANAMKGGQKDHALVCADEQLIFTSSIIEMFNDTNCPSLKGKPKIFLIQACRGEDLDHGHDVFVAYPKYEDRTCSGTTTEPVGRRQRESFDTSDTRGGKDSWTTNQPRSGARHEPRDNLRQEPQFCMPRIHATGGRDFITVHGATSATWASSRTVQKIYAPTPYAIVETPSLTCDSDMLVMYAIPPGKFAWRNSNEGSWMIHYLHEVLMSHNLRNPKSFLSLLTQVSAKMSHRSTNTPSNLEMHGKTAISVIEHKLTKDIIFEQKVPMSSWLR